MRTRSVLLLLVALAAVSGATAAPAITANFSSDLCGVRFVSAGVPFNVTVGYTSDDCSLDCTWTPYAYVQPNTTVDYQLLGTQYGYDFVSFAISCHPYCAGALNAFLRMW